jgi:predicted ester cyclase
MPETDVNTPRIRMLFDWILNQHDDGLPDDLFAADYIDHNPVPGQVPGTEGIRNKVKGLHAAFPGIRFLMEDFVADNNLAAARYYWNATLTGTFPGLAPTGNRVRVGGMDFYRQADWKLLEHWDPVDQLGLMPQQGIIR